MLKDEVPMVRVAAAAALCAVGGPDDDALNSLISDSRHTEFRVRAQAVYELGECGKNEKRAVEALIAGLADEHPYVRRSAASALKAVGRPAAIKAIPALEKLLTDPDNEVRADAKEALASLTSK